MSQQPHLGARGCGRGARALQDWAQAGCREEPGGHGYGPLAPCPCVRAKRGPGEGAWEGWAPLSMFPDRLCPVPRRTEAEAG